MRTEVQLMYEDISACLFALKNLLVSKQLVTHDEFVQAFQERALTLSASPTAGPTPLLRAIATGSLPRESDL